MTDNENVLKTSLNDNLTPSMCSEMLDTAHYPIVGAIGFHRVDCVVVGCLRLEVVHAHPENGIGMARVKSDWRLRRLAEFLRTSTVMHDSEVLWRTSGIVACPPDDR